MVDVVPDSDPATESPVDHGQHPDAELFESAMRPALHAGIGFKVHLTVLILLALAGIAAYGYQLVGGIGTTGLNDQVFWGVYTAALVTFIGFSYGGALVSAILRFTGVPWRGGVSRIAEATALATLVLFGLPLVADMGMLRDRPEITGWRRRLYGWLSFGWNGSDRQRISLERALTVVAILIVPLAIIVHTVLSYAFSLTSRPGWHSTIFGPYFVIGAIYSGVAVVILAAVSYRMAYGLQRWIEDRVIRNLGYILVALAVAYGYATFTEVTTEGYVSETADASILFALVLDEFAPFFWGFVILGLVVPVLLVAIPRTRTPSASPWPRRWSSCRCSSSAISSPFPHRPSH